MRADTSAAAYAVLAGYVGEVRRWCDDHPGWMGIKTRSGVTVRELVLELCNGESTIEQWRSLAERMCAYERTMHELGHF